MPVNFSTNNLGSNSIDSIEFFLENLYLEDFSSLHLLSGCKIESSTCCISILRSLESLVQQFLNSAFNSSVQDGKSWSCHWPFPHWASISETVLKLGYKLSDFWFYDNIFLKHIYTGKESSHQANRADWQKNTRSYRWKTFYFLSHAEYLNCNTKRQCCLC